MKQNSRISTLKTLASDLRRRLTAGDGPGSPEPATWHARSSAEVVEALRRFDAGTYGVCTGCGCDIPLTRLRACPEAVRCIHCQTAYEQRQDRPPLYMHVMP